MARTAEYPQLTDAQKRLAESGIGLAYHFSKPYRLNNPSLDDELLSEAFRALMVAAKGFDPQRGTKFSTHAVHWIRGYVAAYVRNRSRQPRPQQLSCFLIDTAPARASHDCYHYRVLADRMSTGIKSRFTDPAPTDGESEANSLVSHLLTSLPREHANTLAAFYGVGNQKLSDADIVARERVGRNGVPWRLKSALAAARRILETRVS